ncbi:non-hydrolyzing UDP-N-acetylglucosamine 2-epimerase [Alkalilimnicola ehrlichii MLHE-1]|uniref:UDP-N-acetylglucosamine 2-epimerase n=1 Tax=Alkalilimnicola ehrlichii (strain ATCC BAA-1101 / DSM 17681 / MLHE-1) TaxID=187272 RepID=Q0ACH1_ALKEH|nr:UDP-N-acetylglucosamine 2-epimerase (non-hydrolyzing) [Alkalilimnicola ehrlichii]ABI55466.1 UDP-N-acetylglucosamine 2-epimerase [Alkalilimnicola ehrlichii MLHE-1]
MPSKRQCDILCIVGARPNFMKIAPVMRALQAQGIPARLVHTGQHYDAEMNERFFADLGIPHPDINLEVGSASHAVQTAEVMRRFEPVVDELQPRAVLVVGDVNSTIACALVAAKKGVGVIHVEAGLRSYDRAMPEEINRVLTDQISDLLFTTERHAEANLAREGIDTGRVHFVGNVMIDTLRHNLERAVPWQEALAAAGVDLTPFQRAGGYGAVTLHRPSNVDEPAVLRRVTETLIGVSRDLPLVFPVHPRTRARLEAFGLLPALASEPRIALLPPAGYLEMLGLMRDARVVLTDSGGMQEETTALGVPCITLRENTERPITLDEGTNVLVGNDPGRILAAFNEVLGGGGKQGRVPDYWDGRAAERIVEVLADWLAREQPAAAG